MRSTALRALVLALVALPLSVAASTAAPRVDGKVVGRVLFEGKRPEPKPLSGTPEQTKGCCPGEKPVNLADPSLIVDEKGGLANVVVTIEVPGEKANADVEALVVDQRQCVFEPHVSVVHAGAVVRFLNSDSVTHNVRAICVKNEQFNKVMTPGGKEDVVFALPDRVQIQCTYHPWMSTWIYVTDTPHHAVTKPDGTFTIAGLKPGTYKAKLWQEFLGRAEAQVVIKDDGSCEPLEIRMAEKKKK